MDHKMVLISAIIDFIGLLLLLFFLFIAASDVDKSKARDEQLRGGTAS